MESRTREMQGETTQFSTSKATNKPLPLRLVVRFSQWFRDNTFTPRFLSGVWSRPTFGYLAALVIQLMMALAIFTLVYSSPSFRFPEGPLILVILLVALGWGAGPSIIATLVGAGSLLFFVVPPVFSFTD